MVSNTAETPSGPVKWNAASTIDDLQDALAEINALVASEEARKVELEADAGEFVLTGGDIGARAREAYEVDHRLAGHRGARDIIAKRLEAAKLTNHRRLADEDLAAAQGLVPDLKVRWQGLYAALQAVADASELIGEVVRAISEKQVRADQLDYETARMVNFFAVRAEAAAECKAPVRGVYERHQMDADNIALLAKQVLLLVAGRLEPSVGAMHATNRELIDFEMSREARDGAALRRALISSAKSSSQEGS